MGGKPCLADLLDHDPVLRVSDRIRGPRHGPFGTVHARRDGDRRRGVAFSLRTEAPGRQARSARLLGRAFGAGSVAAPLLFGASAAALAQVSSSAHGPATVSSLPWTGLFAGIVGLLAVALCAHLAATFVTNRLERASQAALADRFRRRGLQTGASVLALSLLSLLAAAWKAPALWHRLSTAALPLLVIGFLAMVLSLYALARRRYLLARGATMLTAGAIVWGGSSPSRRG